MNYYYYLYFLSATAAARANFWIVYFISVVIASRPSRVRFSAVEKAKKFFRKSRQHDIVCWLEPGCCLGSRVRPQLAEFELGATICK